MRTLVASCFMTLDGSVERPDQWTAQHFDDAVGEVIGAGMAAAGTVLLGRTLYDEWAAHWPQHQDDPFAGFITGIDKVVLTHRPDDVPEWTNVTVIGDDHAARVRALKESGDGEIGINGSPSTVGWLLQEGLLDQLNLLVFPVVVGSGRRLFEDGIGSGLSLVHCTALPTGVLHLRYAVAS